MIYTSKQYVARSMCAALALSALFVASAPLAYAAQNIPTTSYDYDMSFVRKSLIEQYLYQFGYPQKAAIIPISDGSVLGTNSISTANSESNTCIDVPSRGNPLLQNIRTLMVLYYLYRNNNDGLLSPSRANVGDLIVLYMLFCSIGPAR
jgi:hypothetical protein